MEDFAAWLNKELRRRDLNYSGLASLVGVRANTARSWAIGSAIPSPKNVLRLAEAFSVPEQEL